MARILMWGALALAVVGGIFTAVTVPSFDSLAERRVVESSKIYDRTGEVLLYDIHADVKRTVLPFDKIPRQVKNATVAIEDANFYSHMGIRPFSILRAVFVNLFARELKQGGSTITQQLVKNVLLTKEKSFIRKIKEVILAFKLEARFSKDEILNLYLNEIPYGASAYGIEAASRTYLGKSAENLTLAEAAYLAALPKAPTHLSPYGTHREELEARKRLVLEKMKELGFISEEEYQAADEARVKFLNRALEGIRAPHFSLYVKEYLVEKYGEDAVERGGLSVLTTLNWDWQAKAEELVKKFAEENEKKFNAANAGLVATDPKTGQILAMVGSRDYFSKPLPDGCNPGKNCGLDPEVNVALTRRQPGSAFKPFVYATAFEKGYGPETAIFDLPTEFNPLCDPEGKPGPGVEADKCYHPSNYDEKFRGPISFREALAQSVNLPAVKVLYLSGLSSALNFAKRVGIKTLNDPERYGLTLVLGGGEVRLLELIGAYGAFANDGVWNEPTPILKVTDASGKTLEEYENRGAKAMEPQIAREISDVLSDNEARAPAFGIQSALYFPERPVAVKTGTTNDYRDAWVIGYAPNIAAGVWAGNNDNTSMEKKVAGFIAAPLWNAFLKEIFKDLPLENFKSPAPYDGPKPILNGLWRGGRSYKIDKISKKLATPFTPEELVEEKVIGEVHSILNWVEKEDPLGEPPKNPADDPQFKNWEVAVRSWALRSGLVDENESVMPQEFDDLHRPEFVPQAVFLAPPGEVFTPHSKIRTELKITSRFPVEQVDFFLGSRYLGSVKNEPFEFVFPLEAAPGEVLELSARVYDEVRNKNIVSKTIRAGEN